MNTTWKRSQWVLIAFVSVSIATIFISASVLQSRMHHPNTPPGAHRNLTPSVGTLVIEDGWDVRIFLGNESHRRNASPMSSTDPIRQGDFVEELTDCSVELYNPIGVADGLLEQYIEQRGDTLFLRKPNQRFPGLLRLNLPALTALDINSQEDLRMFLLPDQKAALNNLRITLSGTSDAQIRGYPIKTLSVRASDEAYFSYTNDGRNDSIASRVMQVMVDAQDRSFIEINGFLLVPDEMDIALKEEAVFINSPTRTYTAWGSLANEQ